MPRTVQDFFFIANIMCFNTVMNSIYSDQSVPPDDAKVVTLMLDVSGSMKDHWQTMLLVVGALLLNSNIDSSIVDWELPALEGRTALIDVVQKMIVMPAVVGNVIWLVSDGEENCFIGKFFNSKMYPKDDSVEYLAMDAPEMDFSLDYNRDTLENKAARNRDFVKYMQACGIKLMLVGVGENIKPMLESLVNVPNIYVGHVVSELDALGMLDVVSTLKKQSRGGVQTALIVSDVDRKRKVGKTIGKQQMELVNKLIGNIRIKGLANGTGAVAAIAAVAKMNSAVPVAGGFVPSVDTLGKTFDLVFDAFSVDEEYKMMKDFVLNLQDEILLYCALVANTAHPSVIVSGKKNNNVTELPAGLTKKSALWTKSINRLCSILSNSDHQVLVACGKTDADGTFKYNKKKCNYKASCAMYKSNYPLYTLQEFRNSARFASLPPMVLPAIP